jgi:competence protein ComFC
VVIKLEGNWRSGRAYDLHTVASTYLGVDEFGRDRFDNTRSEMGDLVYQLKYKGDQSVVTQIMKLLDNIGGIEKFDFLIPIPPTNRNRSVQPVELITEALGKRRGVPVLKEFLRNSGDEELKSITDPVARDELLQKALEIVGKENISDKKVLLVDDLYRSGSTLRIATDLLYNKAHVGVVSVLTMTKTRANR